MSKSAEGIKIGQVLKELQISKKEFENWQSVMDWKIPKDHRGHRVFNGDWLKYLNVVNQRVKNGQKLEDIYYAVESPDRRFAPPTVAATVYEPAL